MNDKFVNSLFLKYFQDVYAGKIDTWDYQWNFAVIINNGLVVVLNKNLISNIGFSPEATLTRQKSIFSEIPVTNFDKVIENPNFILYNEIADINFFKSTQHRWNRIGNIFRYSLNIITKMVRTVIHKKNSLLFKLFYIFSIH